MNKAQGLLYENKTGEFKAEIEQNRLYLLK
jgi:hypothetical protein